MIIYTSLISNSFKTPHPDTHSYPVPYTCTLHITLENPRIYCSATLSSAFREGTTQSFLLVYKTKNRVHGAWQAACLFAHTKRTGQTRHLAERIGSCLAAPTTVGGTVLHNRSLQEYCTMKMESSFIGWPPPPTARLAKTVHSTARRPA